MRFAVCVTLGTAFCALPTFAQNNLSPGQSMTSESLPDAPQAATPQADVPRPLSNDDVDLKGLPLRFVKDEVGIFTSPLRTSRSDLKWLIPLAGATAASLSTDTYTMRNVVSHNTSFNSPNATASDVLRGAAIGVPALLFATGHLRNDDAMRRTGLLAGEAMIDAYVFDEAIKYVTLRERPNVNNAQGHFFTGDASSSPSFVSGHSIVAWSSAAVLAGQYSRPWQQVGIYSLASGVSLTRVLSQNHFPTDALLGSAAGWLIGRYVLRAHTKTHGH